jgi:hypothetical protein
MNEADTCRMLVRPRLGAAVWDKSPHSVGEQVSFTDGWIVVAGSKAVRRDQKRADFLLRYRRDFTLAVVEAKRVGRLQDLPPHPSEIASTIFTVPTCRFPLRATELPAETSGVGPEALGNYRRVGSVMIGSLVAALVFLL